MYLSLFGLANVISESSMAYMYSSDLLSLINITGSLHVVNPDIVYPVLIQHLLISTILYLQLSSLFETVLSLA